MKKLIRILLLVICVSSIQIGASQQLTMDLMKDLKPRSIGPAGMSGRVTAIDVVHSNDDIIYVGSASGGLWKSENGGTNWTPLFDKEKVMSIGSVAIQQSNPNVIWVGTGEGNPRNSLNGGFGLYKSTDAGRTWQLVGLEKTRHIHRIKIDPQNPNTIYVGAIGSPWGNHAERGVFKTVDGGKSWKKVLYVNGKTGCADLVMDPNNPNKLFAAMWEHSRKAWTFESGGPGSGLYYTNDAGENWKKLTEKEGLPKGNLGRIGVAVAKSNSKRVYALIESQKNALYRSDDGGYNWKIISDKKSEIGNRPFYYSEIYVDSENENRLYTLFTYVNVSEDGGKSFNQLMDAYNTMKGVHPDHHSFWIHPENPNYIIDGNDGGVNISKDRGKSWRFVENLPLAQFYHINVDNDYPYNVYGGLQDNGSWIGPAFVWKAQGIRNSYWQELTFGDGFDVMPDPDDNRYGYSMAQQGFLLRYDRNTGYNKFIQPTHPNPDQKLRFNWNAAIAQDPFDKNTIYYGSQFVHKSTDKGMTWSIISPDLTTNNPKKQKQYISGGLTMDATGAENNTTILAISPSKLQDGLIWVGTDDGQIQLTKDGGKTWVNLTQKVSEMPKECWVNQIKTSEYNPAEAFLVVNNYRNFDHKPYLFQTKDYGNTWKMLVDQNEVWNYTLSFVQDPVEPKLMFLGTESGMYYSINEGNNWVLWDNELPHVPVMDLVIHPREHDLVIGTYGRSVYVLDDIRPLREIAKIGNFPSNTIRGFTPPRAIISFTQQAPGTRFVADAIFNGENKKSGAMLSFSFYQSEDNNDSNKKKTDNHSIKNKDEKIDEDTVFVHIYNSENERIRTLKQKAPKENGIYRMYWELDEKGINVPSRKMNEVQKNEPSGMTVLPGKYKVQFVYKDQKDSTYVDVEFDPRFDTEYAVLKSIYDYQKQVENELAKVSESVSKLIRSKSALAEYIVRMKNKDKLHFKKVIDKTQSHIDSIEHLIVPFIGEDNEKKQGIIGEKYPNVMNRFRLLNIHLNTTLTSPNETHERLFGHAKKYANIALDSTEKYFKSEEWMSLKEELEALDLSLLTDL